jgi:hydroxymethylpyrimidine/phosphomethylpyrimidine kinase
MRNKKYTCILTIAGSDSSGGAGIQADLKTFSALGCYGMSVITALTAQNTSSVDAIHAVPAKFVGQQIDAIFSDIEVAAIKIGMLHNIDIIEIVANKIKARPYNIPIVLDPVMVAKSGDTLLESDAIEFLLNKLVPLVTIITPNLPEAQLLLNKKIESRDDIKKAAKELCQKTLQAVLIKGGHLRDNDKCTDCLYVKAIDRIYWYEAERIKTQNTHGTGCTLSSAIASFLALGYSLYEAVAKAKVYLSEAILAGSKFTLGHGYGPVQHFHEFR